MPAKTPTKAGNEFVNTVYPAYAEGTKEFVVLESRHTMVGQIILGQESFGTCQILEKGGIENPMGLTKRA
jgi:hypothetical protein